MVQSTENQYGSLGQAVNQSRGETIRRSFESQPKGLVTYLREYAENDPCAAAMWCFGLGFVVGWKMKPW